MACLVYTSSSLLEQSTPTALAVTDLDGSVSDLSFSDQDLDSGELGGNASWQPPGTLDGRVLSYSVYLATDTAGSVKSQVDSIPVGTNIASWLT
ncbi:unnamed protein product [Effrenium voratum]|uniref:Uncharacterized protein n=1 Tax=Effrenium voratum TaxID=2562239 RepID=A0AA36JL20_9DINO|nr:unnamed protein product [Effrenium voratum]